MTPFERSKLDWQGRSVKERIKDIQEQCQEMGINCTWKEAKRQYQRVADNEIWVNDKYQVNIDRSIIDHNIAWIHLSIKTHSKTADHDWREFQQIKDELIGPEYEGIELYPAHSRVVDTANQFHIWVLADPAARIPVGWQDGLIAAQNLTVANNETGEVTNDHPRAVRSGGTAEGKSTQRHSRRRGATGRRLSRWSADRRSKRGTETS